MQLRLERPHTQVPTCVLIQVGSGHDSTGDGPACKDLSLHLMATLQSTVLGDHEALVVPQRGAGAIGVTCEALVLVVALQNKAPHRHRIVNPKAKMQMRKGCRTSGL